MSNSFLVNLAKAKDFCAARESSWDRTGGNADYIHIAAGATVTLAELEGPGVVSHIWFTGNCTDVNYLRKLLLRAYWDGETTPSIDTPLGDFFGVGHGRVTSYQCLAFNMSSNAPGHLGRPAAMNCFLPMPFHSHARIQIVNECDIEVPYLYYYIDYQKHESLDSSLLQLHAKWHRTNPCIKVNLNDINLTGDDNYTILEARGRGHYVGCNLSVDNLMGRWWGEGDDMIFVDGAKWPPTLHGTGSEDYFAHAYGMQDNAFLFNGLSFHADADQNRGKSTVYRHHILDPIPFRESIRVTIEHGHANDRCDDYASVAYWYQTEPHAVWAPMPPVEARIPRE